MFRPSSFAKSSLIITQSGDLTGVGFVKVKNLSANVV